MLEVTRTRPFLAPMREMFNSFADGLAEAPASATLPVDILEKEGHYEILASVPGVTREQITLELDHGVLTIGVEAVDTGPDETCSEDCSPLRRERFTGARSRRVRLPSELDDGTIEAGLENGVLTITLARPVETGPRRIAIT